MKTRPKRICGIAIATSAVRISNSSTSGTPRAAAKPQATPSTRLRAVAPNTAPSVTRPPYSMREKRSRPSSSVPNQWAELGG